tara:strand:+ start:387 stop:650 length:264 start_codon:yes stop_codon:yes gene_type:complete
MRNTDIIAINKKHQSLVNKAVAWDIKYEYANTQRDFASDNTLCDYVEDDPTWRKWDKQCERASDKYEDYLSELPKGEQKNVTKQLQY